jgi:type IX secretion system PorP/SprF family membrane protein
MKTVILISFFLPVFLSLKVSAQDHHVSQYFSNPLYLNPAFTGSAGCSRITSNERIQWPFVSFGYKNTTISYDQYVHTLRGGLGFILLAADDGEILFTQSANLFYSYNIRINSNLILKPAIEIGMGYEYLEWMKVEYGKPVKGEIINYNNPFVHYLDKFYFNIGAGFLFAYKNLVTGFAIDHINRPDEGFLNKSRMHIKWTIHSSFQFNIKKIVSITPAIIYLRQHTFSEITPSVLFKVGYLKFGIGFRFNENNPDAMFITSGFQNKWMSIAYSYDYSISKIGNSFTGGAHEITTMFKFNCKNKTDKFHIAQINGF